LDVEEVIGRGMERHHRAEPQSHSSSTYGSVDPAPR
jgi:hypothetical protein